MYSENKLNADSLKAVQDSVKAAQESELMNTVGFNISNIGNAEIILTVLGYGIVFLSLLVLYMFISNLTKLLIATRRKKLRKAGKSTADKDLSISGETSAAISTAILLHYQEVHDFENTVITIKKVQSAYSPWNSKLYGLRQNPKY
jgi:Na+-transporting methylmalonyl-CoA/oxaloacetate decarboxylase gamma subunit